MCCIGNSFSLSDQRHYMLVVILADQEGVKCNNAIKPYMIYGFIGHQISCVLREKRMQDFRKTANTVQLWCHCLTMGTIAIIRSVTVVQCHGMSSISLPGMSSISLPGMSSISLHDMSSISLLGMSSISLPGMSSISLHGMASISLLGMSSISLCGMSLISRLGENLSSCSYFPWCYINFGLWENLCLTLWTTESHFRILDGHLWIEMLNYHLLACNTKK